MSRVAAIDCGTNSIRLLIAEVVGPAAGAPAELIDLTRRMEIVRLGEGVDRTGRLSAPALGRTRTALTGYAQAIRDFGVERVRMVATSATRDATNADEFTALVVESLGVAPEVVSGEEEARLSFTGAVRGLPGSARPPHLVVDIGGGSTEFVRGDSDGVAAAVSVDIGCVRMTERHLSDDPPTAAQAAAAEADIDAAVGRALAAVAGGRATTLVGLAGSVTTVAGIALGLSRYDSSQIHRAEIGYEAVAGVTEELLGMTRTQRLAVPVMHPGRADVIAAGALILRVVMERASASAVIASEHDILDGIAWSVAGY